MTRASALDHAIDAAFFIALIGVAWLAVFGHRGIAPCVGLMALAAAARPSFWRGAAALLEPRRLASNPLSIAALATASFAVWIALGALWSPTPGADWLALTIAASALAAGAIVHEASAASAVRAGRFGAFFALAVIAATSALYFEAMTGGFWRSVIPPEDSSPLRFKDLTALGRGVTAMAPLVFPAAVLIRGATGSWAIGAIPAALLIVAATQFSIFANVVALAAGAVVIMVALARPRTGLVALTALFVGALLLAPFIALAIPADAAASGEFPASWAQRLHVWREASERALGECFPFGCGADYARAWSLEGAMITLPDWPIPVQTIPTHPHNVFIQVWLELGLPGVLALAVAMLFGARALLRARLDRWTAAAITASAAVSLISVMFEASLWQVWRLAVFALAAFGAAVSYSINKSKQ